MEKQLKALIKKLEKNKREYYAYLRGAPFIIWFMDKKQMKYNKNRVEEKLNYFGIWLKTMDLEMEKKKDCGKEFLEIIRGKKSSKKTLPIELTKKIKSFIKTKQCQTSFEKLYLSVINGKKSKNIKELIKNRKATGDNLAECILGLIEKDISKFHGQFREFLHESMKMNQLMDSYVDMEEDYKKGELKFKPSLHAKNALRLSLFKSTLKNSIKLPSTALFLRSGIKSLKKLK